MSSPAWRDDMAVAFQRIKALETLVYHLAALGPLNHAPCRVCRDLMPPPFERDPTELGGTRQVPRAIRFYGDDSRERQP